MARILVVDDEIGIRELLREILVDEGHSVTLAENATAARAARAAQRPDLVLLDIWMPDTDGISLLKEWAAAGQLTMPVVMMSGHGTIDTAVEATRIGAVDFLEKPIALQKLLATVKRALHSPAAPMVSEPLTLEAFSRVPLLRDLKKRLDQAASRSRILYLRGDGGGLSEVCARSLHASRTPWIDLVKQTEPLSQDLLASLAGGLLFVSDLTVLGRLQQKSLAFAVDRLEKHQLRLVCAAHEGPTELIAAGWDAALVSRLTAVSLPIPALTGHIDDVPEIASLLLALLVERNEVPHKRLTSDALNALLQHDWAGGLGELAGVLKSLALTALEEDITGADVTAALGSPGHVAQNLPLSLDVPFKEARDDFERLYFEYHLQKCGGHMTRLAEVTGVERTHLYRKLKSLGLNAGRRADEAA